MIGDAEDRARWEKYARLVDGAARLEALARKSRSVDEAMRLVDEARALRVHAHTLTV